MHPYIHAQKTPDKIAYLMAGSGQSVSYRQLDDASNRFAQLLRARGLKAGDHIAILLENHVRFFEICWGAQRAGIIYTAISSRLTAGEAAYIVADCAAKLLVTSQAMAGIAAEILPEIGNAKSRLMIDGTIAGYESYEQAVAAQPATPHRRRDRRQRHALFVRHHRPPEGRLSCRRNRPPIDADQPADRGRAGCLPARPGQRSTCRRRRSITPRRCAST